MLSARNQFAGTITSVKIGNVMAEVVVQVGGLEVVSLISRGWITSDPTYRMRAFASGEFHTWTEDEIAQFEAHWPIGSKQRLAFALHLYTGQRRSDVHRMTWADYDGESIRVGIVGPLAS